MIRSSRNAPAASHSSSGMSGVWEALARQRALVEEAQKWLSDRNAEMAELRVAYAAVKEEAVQAWATEAVAREGGSPGPQGPRAPVGTGEGARGGRLPGQPLA
jgi:hypothetical protein